MKHILIFLLGLITFQVNAQKIIGSTTTAGGDLQGTYPNPTIKNNSINSANLTFSLQDSINQPRDTVIKLASGADYIPDIAIDPILARKFKNIYIISQGASLDTPRVFFLTNNFDNDFKGVVFHVLNYGNFVGTVQIGSTVRNSMSNISYALLTKGQRVEVRSLEEFGTPGVYNWYMNKILDTIPASIIPNITLSGDITGTGAFSDIPTTLSNNAVTTTKILDANVTLNKLASSSVNSAKIVDASIALADMASNSINGSKIIDYSINGDDIGYSTLRAGDASNAILKFATGSVLTTPQTGAWEFDNSKLNFTINSVRKRFAVFNEAAPTSGQLPIGNGTDFTLATIIGGNKIVVTNGSGTISIATYPKRDTIIYLTNADYNINSNITGTQILNRYNKIIFVSYLTGAASSDNEITFPVPSSDLEQCEFYLYSYDESGDADVTEAIFGTNLGVVGDGTYNNGASLIAGQKLSVRCMKDPKDSNNYKFYTWY